MIDDEALERAADKWATMRSTVYASDGKIIGHTQDVIDHDKKDAFLAGAAWATARERERAGKLVEAAEKFKNIKIDHDCEECGCFTSVRYEIKPIHEALQNYKRDIGEG